MSVSTLFKRVLPLAAVLAISASLSACGVGSLTTTRTQGYEISNSALQQIRPGQSQDLVVAVLGSPQTQGTFGDESAFYYVETKIEQTAFGLRMVQSRTVLAVYFDDNRRVTDKAVYTLQDGRVFALETRRTASFGQDRSFVQQILESF